MRSNMIGGRILHSYFLTHGSFAYRSLVTYIRKSHDFFIIILKMVLPFANFRTDFDLAVNVAVTSLHESDIASANAPC